MKNVEPNADDLLPNVFHICDKCAVAFQHRFLQIRRCHIAIGLVGASVAQLAVSLLQGSSITNNTDVVRTFQWLLAFCVLTALSTRIYLRLHPLDALWCNARRQAERIRMLSWLYIMKADWRTSSHKTGNSVPETDTSICDEIDQAYKSWSQTLPKSAGRALPPAPEPCSQQMEPLRTGHSLDERARIYLRHRIQEQYDWLTAKSSHNHRWHRWLRTSTYGFESVAMLIALDALLPDEYRFLARLYPTLLWFCLSLAGSTLAWMEQKRYRELAENYAAHTDWLGNTARKLDQLLQTSSLDETGFVEIVRETEDNLSSENHVWFARRTGSSRPILSED